MKRIIILTCIMSILLLITSNAYGADALYRMLHADEVKSFQADQSAFVVAQLVGRDNDRFVARVLKVISGNVKSEDIKVFGNFEYGYGLEPKVLPKVNDYCVLSLKKTGLNYKIAWGAFKADSGEYKTLRLLTDEIRTSPGLMADIACIEWYVNSGGTENDFSFEGDGKGGSSAYVKRPNGESVRVYPKDMKQLGTGESGTTVSKQEKPLDLQVKESTESSGLKTVVDKGMTVIAIMVLAVISTIGIVVAVKCKKYG